MKNLPTLILSLLLLITCSAVHADNIIIASDKWCPYNCEPNAPQEGYMIDIARAIFEKAGHTIEYKTTSWARAVADARAGKITGVVGALHEDAPGFVFPTQSQGSVQFHFYVLKNKPWRYKNIDSLLTIKLAVINDYGYDPDMNTFIAKHTNQNHIKNDAPDQIEDLHVHVASGENALENNIRMVIQGHVDTLIEDPNVFSLTANKMGVMNQLIDAGSSDMKNPIYIAFSPTNPKSQQYADLLSNGIMTLRKSGELQKILSAYGMSDWEINKE